MPKDGGSRRRHLLDFHRMKIQKKEWFTAGLITYACHWLARGVAEWGDKTSWKECTCRSAQGFHKEETLTPDGVRVFQRRVG